MAFHFKTILFVTSLSLLLHSLLLYCPVDILFKSKDPLPRNGLTPQMHSLLPPASRLVLFIVNNATASDVYSVKNEDQPGLPFIRSVIRKKGRWGISYFSSSDANDGFYNHTSNLLPFLTGTYSDNNEDTVLRSARKVWIWCTRDGSCLNNDMGAITRLFESPLTAAAASNGSLNWMSDHVENLFLVGGNEETVSEELMQDKTIFYFNFGSADLSSIDTAMQNISSFFDSYYKDRKTTFVFTASVLSNDTIESLPLMLPFIAWGAGIKNPRSKHSSLLTVHDEWSELWGLEHFERVDLDQTDIAPLLSVLIGTRIPLHSLGVLPVHYIHYNKEFFAEASYSSALQLLELVAAKEKSIQSRSLPFLFRPYQKLTQEIKHERKTMIYNYIRQRKLQEALDLSMELASLAKEAIQYYDVYHQLSVRLIIALLLFGWISYLITILTRQDHEMEPADSRKRGLYYFTIFSSIVGFGFLLWYQGMPPHFMLYFCVALLLWSGAINNWKYVSHLIKESSKNPAQFYTGNFIVFASIAGIELIVFGFNGKPYLLSLLWLGLSLWPLLTKQGKENLHSSLYWSISCIMMTAYLSILSKSSMPSLLNTVVGLLAVVLVLFLLLKPSISYALTSPSSSLFSSKVALWIQLLSLFLAVLISNPLVKLHVNTYYANLGLVLMSLTLLFGLSLSVYGRLLQLGLITLLLSIISSNSNNGSTIFFVLLNLCHYAWLVVEDLLINRKENKVASLWDGIVAYATTETPVLIPRNEISRTEYATAFRRAVIAFTMLATSLHHLDSPNLFYGNQDELILFSSQFMVLITITLCCYNILASLAKSSLLVSLIILTVAVDLVPLHFLFFIRGTTIKDESLIHFYVSVALAMLLPFLLLIVQVLTGRAIIPRKSDGLND